MAHHLKSYQTFVLDFDNPVLVTDLFKRLWYKTLATDFGVTPWNQALVTDLGARLW